MTAVHRYEIPVDNQWHTLELSGAIVHIATRSANKVEVWALDSGGPLVARSFRVYGTGHDLPDSARHVGTALTGRLVWHLMEGNEP